MHKEDDRTPEAGVPQVFELTMDNPEDQDELNRRLKKPAPSKREASGDAAQSRCNESTERPSKNRKRKS